jgi:two-component system sensor histidine kinase BaeS
MSRRRSLRTHLFAATAAVVALSVGLTVVIGSVLTRRQVQHATLLDVSHQADLLAERERVSINPLGHNKSLKAFAARQNEGVKTPLLSQPTPWLSDDDRHLVTAGRSVNGTVRVHGKTYYFAARRVGLRALVLLRPKSFAAWPYIGGLLVAALAGATLALVASFLLARRISRPVTRVADAARRLAGRRTPEPIPIEGATELAALAAAFNEMAGQLAKARAAERSFLLSVSHELKTPLTAIRGYAEGLSDGAFGSDEAAETIAREAARLERLVQDLLELARMNRSEFSVHRESIELAAAAREAVARYEAQARAFGVTLEAVAPVPAPAIGDGDRTLQVVSNLVENALRLTPPGGLVRVVAEPGSIAVEDTGPGLKPDELPHAFERFFLYSRYGGERPVGTGLGLAIVKELTEGMHGSVEVESEPGRLTRFVVRLPHAAAAELGERELTPA